MTDYVTLQSNRSHSSIFHKSAATNNNGTFFLIYALHHNFLGNGGVIELINSANYFIDLWKINGTGKVWTQNIKAFH